jgi:hypothetical protein
MPGPVFPADELVKLLGASIGDEMAAQAIGQACKALDLDPARFDRDQALRVLEKIAETRGLVGISARFAKSRVHLKW